MKKDYRRRCGRSPDRATGLTEGLQNRGRPAVVVSAGSETGAERWVFDPEIDLTGRYANQLICRGVSTWLDPAARDDASCRRTILTGTNDARLIALDARTGTPCPDFGSEGVIDLNPGPGPQHWKGEYQVTSPPAVVGDVVVMGSAVSDNARIGQVTMPRAWLARSTKRN